MCISYYTYSNILYSVHFVRLTKANLERYFFPETWIILRMWLHATMLARSLQLLQWSCQRYWITQVL